jgi:hypothetical protein
MDVRFPKELQEKLEAQAQRERRSVEDVVISIVEQHIPEIAPQTEDAAPAGTLAAFIAALDEALDGMQLPDDMQEVAENSQSILRREFPEYLARKYGLGEEGSDET